MLDQNTDRMWFVIGALVIGAGIILLANKTMPEVFANVTKQMKNITNSATDEIDNGMFPNPNIAKNSSYDWQTYSGSSSKYSKTIGENWFNLEEEGLKPGDKITFSFDYDFGTDTYVPRLNFSPYPYETDDEREIARVGKRLTGSGHYSYTITVPNNTNYFIPLMNNGLTDGSYRSKSLKLRMVKIEKGDKETRYTP